MLGAVEARVTQRALLVGSIPLDTVEQVFRTFGKPVGPALTAKACAVDQQEKCIMAVNKEHREFVISGDLVVGNDEQGNGGQPFFANTYCVRPPGVAHGPFKSETGCLLLEQHYYDPQ